jgi:phosphatidylglycerophosphatase A
VTEKRAGAAVWIATCGGVGYFPVAPGTAGSAVGVVLVVALGRLPVGPAWRLVPLGAAAVVVFFLGVWSAGHAERFFNRVDPRFVVIDEVAGQMITFLARPDASWKWLLAGFVLFRLFDVLKPFPAGRAERLPGGWGIMTDDVVAGGYALVALLVLEIFLR